MCDENLVIDNINLIYYVIKRMKLYGDLNEYYEEGLIGLVKASKNYDLNSGYKFSTFATKCIFNEISKYIRINNYDKRKANKNTISLETLICDGIKLQDILVSDINLEKDLIEKEQIKLLYNSILKLSEKEKFVINHFYGLNNYKKMTQKEIAKILRVERSTISKIVETSKRKLKKMMKC